MPVFGEETFDLPIFNGLGITDRPVSDLCAKLTNMFLCAPNELRLREDFVLIQQTTRTPIAIATVSPVPRHTMENNIEVFTAIGSETVNSPSILSFFDDGASRDVTWVNTNATTPTSIVQSIPANYGVKAFCQFKDRYYGSNAIVGANGKIFRMTGFTAVGSPMTNTDCTGATTNMGVDILLTFRSRMFGIKKNRIYYTDLPTIGGYPEVWDVNTKFVDIPSVDFDVTVYNAFIYKDKIYMFTDKGIYVFNVVGDPTNWSIQLVSSNFPIYDRDSVAINKNFIFLTDQTNVVIFDGSQFKVISENIRSVFHNNPSAYNWFSIYPWEDGVLLVRNAMNNSAGFYAMNSASEEANSSLILYYNMQMWTEVKFGFNSWGVIKAGRSLLPYRGKVASSWIDVASSPIIQNIYFYDGGRWAGDVASIDHVAGLRIKKYVDLISPTPFLKDRSFKKYKFVDLYGYLNDVTGTPSYTWFNGEVVLSIDKGKSIWKIPISDTLGSQFKGMPAAPLTIVGYIDYDQSGVKNVPPFLIIGADLIYNQDNRGRDGMTS